MTLEEIIDLINIKQLNHKTNNYIIKNVDKENEIISRINSESIIENLDDIKKLELSFSQEKLINIFINLNDIDYYNVLNMTLDFLGIDEKVKLKTMKDILRFKGLLRKNNKAVQFIITNPGVLAEEDAKIFNQLLYFNTYYFNLIIIGELKTYEVIGNKILDNRENYTNITLSKLFKKEQI